MTGDGVRASAPWRNVAGVCAIQIAGEARLCVGYATNNARHILEVNGWAVELLHPMENRWHKPWGDEVADQPTDGA